MSAAIKRRVVKRPKYTPEELEAQRLERIRRNEEDRIRLNKQLEEDRKAAAEKLAKYEAELAADKRPRWMRESVVDPDWIGHYEKTHRYENSDRQFQLGIDMIDCVYHAGGRAICDVFGTPGLLARLAKAASDEDTRADLSDDANGAHELATAVAAVITATFDAADDTIPEDAKPGQLPDRTKAEKELATTLIPAMRQLQGAVDMIMGRLSADVDPIRDQLWMDLVDKGRDEVELPDHLDVAQIIRDMSDMERIELCRDLGLKSSILDHLA